MPEAEEEAGAVPLQAMTEPLVLLEGSPGFRWEVLLQCRQVVAQEVSGVRPTAVEEVLEAAVVR